MCEHGRRRCRCVQCKGGSICEHHRERSQCVECKGSGICEHNKRRIRCVECKGASICKHKRVRSLCVQCEGAGICEHKKQRSQCVQCKGGGVCEHKRQRSRCVQCAGASICEHKRMRSQCVQCGGRSICEHKRQRSLCAECKGSSICKHNRRRSMCAECEGSGICRTPLCTSYHKGPAYKYRCYPCAVRAYPHEDFPRKRQFRVKERVVVDAIKARFPVYDWSHDRRVPDGCSGLRPDLLLQMGSHVLIVEVDENAHRTTAPQCEIARLNEISSELNFQPVAVLRFNPDAYTDRDGVRHASCFRLNKLGFQVVRDQAVFEQRLARLFARIEHHVGAVPAEMLVVEHLFYA